MATLASPRTSREPVTSDSDAPLTPGTAVEVRNHFDGRWARGFEISAAADGGYLVRRVSDGRELPTVFTTDEIRLHRDRRRDTWWY